MDNVLEAAIKFAQLVDPTETSEKFDQFKEFAKYLGSDRPTNSIDQGSLALKIWQRVYLMNGAFQEIRDGAPKYPIQDPTALNKAKEFYDKARDLLSAALGDAEVNQLKTKLTNVKNVWSSLRSTYITSTFLDSLSKDNQTKIDNLGRREWWDRLVQRIEETITSLETLLGELEEVTDPNAPPPVLDESAPTP